MQDLMEMTEQCALWWESRAGAPPIGFRALPLAALLAAPRSRRHNRFARTQTSAAGSRWAPTVSNLCQTPGSSQPVRSGPRHRLPASSSAAGVKRPPSRPSSAAGHAPKRPLHNSHSASGTLSRFHVDLSCGRAWGICYSGLGSVHRQCICPATSCDSLLPCSVIHRQPLHMPYRSASWRDRNRLVLSHCKQEC